MSLFDPVLTMLSPLWAGTNAVARMALSPRGETLPVPVIAIGNIVAGGVGKTELAAAIAARLVARGKRVVVASRGYGSKWEKDGAVAHDLASASSLRFPDEALVVLSKAPGVAVAVGADRLGVLRRSWAELSPDVVLLDDGYQHFRIRRDLDILVHDFSVRWPVLRDLPGAFKKAKVRISFSGVPKYWQALEDRYPWVQARYRLSGTADSGDRPAALPARALAFCGLGNPQRFRIALERAGVAVEGFRAFRDHADYGADEARKLAAWQRQSGGLPLLTTLKDYVKLKALVESQGGVAGFEPLWVQTRLEFPHNEQLLWKAIDETLAVRRP